MTAIRWVKKLLEDNWTPSRPGRVVDVPEPVFALEQNRSQIDFKTNDVALVKDGGVESRDPRSFGWAEERVETLVSVDLRTSDRREAGAKVDGRERLFGYINETDSTDANGLDPGESEDHPGMGGEVRKIASDVRSGSGPYDLVNAFETNDVSNTVGANRYRATVEIRLTQAARVI